MDSLKTFIQAVCNGDAATVETHLLESPELANTKDDGATPLHFAAIGNHRQLVDLLLDQGADINAIDDEFGSTPAGWANEKGYVEMVHHLVARGAKVDLQRAAGFGLLDLVIELLANDASAVNTSGGWGMPIHEASAWGHPRIVEVLLEYGADPNLKNRDGKTALAIATEQVETNGTGASITIASRKKEVIAGCSEIVEILKRSGARMN
jgi:ankyrin repeat protein